MAIPRALLLLFPVKRRRSTWFRCPKCNLLTGADTKEAKEHRC